MMPVFCFPEPGILELLSPSELLEFIGGKADRPFLSLFSSPGQKLAHYLAI